MKIVMIDSVSDLYGSSKICRLILNLLREADNDVSAYVRNEHLPESDHYAMKTSYPLLVMSDLKRQPLRFTVGFFTDFAKFWRLSKNIFNGSDLVYCNTLGTLPICLIARLRGKRVILHIHESNNFSPPIRWVFSNVINLVSSQAFFVSNSIAVLWGCQDRPRSSVIHNGIQDFQSDEEMLLAISSKRKFEFLFIGRLIEKKGIFLFMEALKLLDKDCAAKNRKITVAIVGGGIPRQAPALSKQDFTQFNFIEIYFLGEINNPNSIFLQSRVVCVPSTYADPYPTVILEGLRAGCSIIASDIGGAKEALESSVCSLFESDNPEALNEAMVAQLNVWDKSSPCIMNRDLFLRKHTLSAFKSCLLPLIATDTREERYESK